MTSRERIKTIFAGKPADRCGTWMGNPHGDTWPIYLKHFNCSDTEALRCLLKDDLRWLHAETTNCYRHPEGKPMFALTKMNAAGNVLPAFADCESVSDVLAYDWPDPNYLDFSDAVEIVRNAGDVYRASGMWTCFFHLIADSFGMENYFVKMYTNPDVVEAVTRCVCEFYLEANERYFKAVGSEMDGFFFGNDFGTQLDLLISPDMFDKFVLPYTRKFAELGHSYGYQVITHSCGAIGKVIDRLIDAGIDALHPIQAKAFDMDAETLAKRFKGRIAFMGGIDTQDLLMNGTPDEVRADVRRVKELLGPCLVVSPSHEALLPNVPPENVLAMVEAAVETD